MPDDVPVTDDIVADFQKNGVVVLRQAFGDGSNRCARASTL